jgi:Protein of unknown function DUF262.
MNKLQSLKDIFNNVILRIPDYQRGYSWGNDQLDDLWNDLSNINIEWPSSYHFTGMLTLDKFDQRSINSISQEGFEVENGQIKIGDNTYKAYNVVDGQQRITTLLILIAVLIEGCEGNHDYKAQFHSVVVNDKKYYLFGYEKDVPSHQFLIKEIFGDNQMDMTEPTTVYTNNLANTKTYLEAKTSKYTEDEKKNY